MRETKTVIILKRVPMEFDSPHEIQSQELSNFLKDGYQIKSMSSAVIRAQPYTGEHDADGVRPQELLLSVTYLLSKSSDI